MQETSTRPLNLDDEVTPNHWSPSRFEKFGGMPVDAEFDAIAKLFIYFDTDVAYRKAALEAARRLKKAKHPLMDDIEPAELIKGNIMPDGLRQRYNALLWHIVDEALPMAEAYIDQWGAYAFRIHGNDTFLAGDASGTFAYYADAAVLRKEVEDCRSS